MHFLITEVHNFGGFFGGDTVTVSGVAAAASPPDEHTLTIDETALANVADRYAVTAGMLFELAFAGDRVAQATLLGARGYPELRRALGPPTWPAALSAPLILARRCAECGFWSVPVGDGGCSLCSPVRVD